MELLKNYKYPSLAPEIVSKSVSHTVLGSCYFENFPGDLNVWPRLRLTMLELQQWPSNRSDHQNYLGLGGLV